MSYSTPDESPVELVVTARQQQLGDEFTVRRALPTRQRGMVGPFIFLDQMGPQGLRLGHGLDVRPHPHIGLATITYLYEGAILHRDSLGVVQRIEPGDMNWMTAGRGIVHSERTPLEDRSREGQLFGIQCWVALPRAHEQTEPAFYHYGKTDLPVLSEDRVIARVVAGRFSGQVSPVPTFSALLQVDLTLQPGASFTIPAEYPEQAVYIAHGTLGVERAGTFDVGHLLVCKPGYEMKVRNAGSGPVRLMLVGGEPLDGPRYISWNFVSSSRDLIEKAKDDWRNQRFPLIPGETEFIPLPNLPGRPVSYP